VRLTLAAGLSTGSKFDAVIQRGTELGVSRFIPLLTEKSKVAVDEPKRAKAKVTRWRRVAMAAMKQCRRSYIPEIAVPTGLQSFLEQHESSDLGLIFHPGKAGKPLSEVGLNDSSKRVTLLVGPESGFSEDELDMARDAGIAPISLGPRILRTETAGPIVVALVMARLGEFR
jgi:16S rRNA (uracil1498-N3)-methyltransferase